MVRLRRLTRCAVLTSTGATALIGVIVAKEHPGGSSSSAHHRDHLAFPRRCDLFERRHGQIDHRRPDHHPAAEKERSLTSWANI